MSLSRMVFILLASVALYSPSIVNPNFGTARAGTICVGEPLPSTPFPYLSGNVIIAAVYDSQCPRGKAYEYTLSEEDLLICANSPKPMMYVVTDFDGNTSICGGVKRYKINTARDGMNVCAISSIPNQYVIHKVTNYECGSGVKKYEIRFEANGLTVCTFTPRPSRSDYIATQMGNSSKCSGAWEFKLGVPSSGSYACEIWPTPNNLAITQVNEGYCGSGYDRLRLSAPYSGIRVCDRSPVPNGYYRSHQIYNGYCGANTNGWVLYRL